MNISGLENYQIEAWVMKMQSFPVKVVAHASRDVAYETHECYVVKLENGKYAVVVEEGCSCYSHSEAVIEILPTKSAAMAQFNKWEKENKRDY